MGFFDDLFSGDFGAVAGDIGGFLSNPINDLALAGSILMPFATPELLGGLAGAEIGGAAGGLFGAGEAAGGLTGSALAGAELGGAAGAGIDLTALGAGGAGGLAALGETEIPANATFTAGTSPFNLTDPTATSAQLGGQTYSGGGAGGLAATGAAPGGATAAGSPLASLDVAGGAGGAGGGAAGASGGGGGLIDSLLSGAGGQIAKNPLGTAAAGIGLGMNLLKGKETDPALARMRELEGGANKQAMEMTKWLSTGTLPPGLQSSVDQAVAAQKARVIQRNASQGLSTDPSQNSALAQELSNIELQATSRIAEIAQSLYAQGVQMAQIDAELLSKIYQADVAQNKQMGDALTNFAKALAPSGPTLKLG